MHNRAVHYCQGTSGWISGCWQVCSQHTAYFLWMILEVWVELPAGRWHWSLWRWSTKSQRGTAVQHEPYSENQCGTKAAYIAFASSQPALRSSEFSGISGVQFCPMLFTAPYCHVGASGAEMKQLWIHITLCKPLFPHPACHLGPEDVGLRVFLVAVLVLWIKSCNQPQVWEMRVIND